MVRLSSDPRWTLQHTGGNCTAWTRKAAAGAGEWYITPATDPVAPGERSTLPCTLTLVKDGDTVLDQDCATLADALANADAGDDAETANRARQDAERAVLGLHGGDDRGPVPLPQPARTAR